MAQYSDPGPIGLASESRFDLLPYLWDGVRVRGASSYDRTDFNDDHSMYAYTGDNEQTLMDVVGAGCIYRFWITGQENTTSMRFYLDNETTPRVNTPMSNIFTAIQSPWLAPLSRSNGQSSGGFPTYLPVQFKQRCRVAVANTRNAWFFYNIQYHLYTDPTAVTTFTGSESRTAAEAVFNSSGSPNPTPDAGAVVSSAALPGSSSVTLADLSGSGSINSILVRIPQVVPNDAASDAILRNVRIQAFWDNDDSQHPSVDAPLGEFFGCGLGEYTVNSLPIRMSTASGDWYRCYFPMPYGSHARIVLKNTGTTSVNPVNWEVHYAAMPDAATMLSQGRIGYFHTFANSEMPTTLNKDYTVLQTAGKGCLVGVVMTMNGLTTERNYLEGDERIYIDGSADPAIYGTGTEDFFNGGWYFKYGTFSLPTHGNPAHEVTSVDSTAVYRFLMADKILYYSSLYVGIEHGDYNNVQGNYSSVAYYYEVPDSTIRLTDEVDVGNTSSEDLHSYTYKQGSVTSLRQRYPGRDASGVFDDGRAVNGTWSFRATIDPANKGIRLRRRTDFTIANQSATVRVDGALVGTWYDGGYASSRWRDSDFDIPAGFTTGKSEVTIQLTASNWNEYRYRVYSFVASDEYPPAPVIGFVAVGQPNKVWLSWKAPSDPDARNVVVRRSTTGYPASPSDGELVCDRPAWSDVPDCFAHTGLAQGVVYYYAAFACDAAGHYSQPAHAKGWLHEPSCQDVKSLHDSAYISMNGKVITAVLPADLSVFVEDPNRVGGIRVSSNGAGLAIGDRVNVQGNIGTFGSSGAYGSERQIVNATISRVSSGLPLAPVAMKCIAVGGAPVPPFVAGVGDAAGLNNFGLLVKIAGKVTRKISNVFYVDDGSNIRDISGRIGVMVTCPDISMSVAVGDIVSVVGVVEGSVPNTLGWANSRRSLHIRSYADITPAD